MIGIEEVLMIIKGDDGGVIEISRSCDNDLWFRTMNEMHAPVRIRTYFGGGGDDEVYKIFNKFFKELEALESKMIVK